MGSCIFNCQNSLNIKIQRSTHKIDLEWNCIAFTPMQESAPSRKDQRYVGKSSQETAQHQADVDGNRRLQDLDESVQDEVAEWHRA